MKKKVFALVLFSLFFMIRSCFYENIYELSAKNLSKKYRRYELINMAKKMAKGDSKKQLKKIDHLLAAAYHHKREPVIVNLIKDDHWDIVKFLQEKDLRLKKFFNDHCSEDEGEFHIGRYASLRTYEFSVEDFKKIYAVYAFSLDAKSVANIICRETSVSNNWIYFLKHLPKAEIKKINFYKIHTKSDKIKFDVDFYQDLIKAKLLSHQEVLVFCQKHFWNGEQDFDALLNECLKWKRQNSKVWTLY